MTHKKKKTAAEARREVMGPKKKMQGMPRMEEMMETELEKAGESEKAEKKAGKK